MKKIYFITRTFVEPKNGKSCVLLNNVYIDWLKKYFHVIVVTPSYNEKDIINEDYIKIEYHGKMLHHYLEKIGLIEDYLDPWVNNTLAILSEKVNEDDIIFATTGGELACIKIASLLKRRKKCQFVINFRDPIDYSYIEGKKTCGYFHVNREKEISEYISNADLVITSSDKFKDVLLKKYVFLNNKVINNYYGYIEKIIPTVNHEDQLDIQRENARKVRLIFGGSMNKPQGAELFLDILKRRNDIEIIYVGEPNKKIMKATGKKNVRVIGSMTHDDYICFATENADIGLVSLAEEPYKACFPSKIFEYINLEIPILAALPDGDAKKVINNNGYGCAVEYGNIDELNEGIEYILNNYKKLVDNIRRDKDKWSMEKQIYEVISSLQML